jgi:cellulose synthase/poly-beta-1,6-N-acetylglucosamine synthase-like glycosyltransferase
MLHQVLFYLFIVVGTLNFIHMGLYIIGANLYDVQQLYRHHQNRRLRPRRQTALHQIRRQALHELETLAKHGGLDRAGRVSLALERYRENGRKIHYVRARAAILAGPRANRQLNLTTLQQYQHQIQKRRQPKRTRGIAPLVSVVIPAHNEELSIERCLDSIRRNTYRKIEVFVHNDKSTDDTARIVRAYQKKYPKFRLRLVNRRFHAGKAEGVNYCIKRYALGDLVMTLDADCTLDRRAIKNSVDKFADPKVIGVAANVKITDSASILGLLQQFEHMIGYRSKKFYTVANCEFVVGGVASTYRMAVLQKANFYDTDTQTEDIGLSMKIVVQANKGERIIYAADVLAMTDPVTTFKGLLIQRYRWKLGMIQNLLKYRKLFGNFSRRYSKVLTLYRIPMAYLSEVLLLLEPFLLVYLFYLSFTYNTNALFVGAYVTITIYVLMGIWPDEHMGIGKKIVQSLYAPIMYFVFYIMDVVQIASIISVLAKPKKMLRKGYTASNWTPPARVATDSAS